MNPSLLVGLVGSVVSVLVLLYDLFYARGQYRELWLVADGAWLGFWVGVVAEELRTR